MARLARAVAPGFPHHVTQRGNRSQPTFFSDDDYRLYRRLIAEWCGRCGVTVWAYCLMPNHVHLIAVPERPDALGAALGEAHRRYSRAINAREGWRGHLWQGRFSSFAMDEPHLLAAARYVELNPVRAGLAARPGDWPWSSARAHLAGADDALVRTAPLLALAGDWAGFLAGGLADGERDNLRRHEGTGRPLGDAAFLDSVEAVVGRALRPGKRGRKPGQRTGAPA